MSDSQNAAGIIARELQIKPEQAVATIELLDEGATVPFIARYRKEKTGSLDEIQILGIRDKINLLRELYSRRDAILKSLTERQLLTPELQEKIFQAETMQKLEDLYLPYRPKRRTRAMIAKEKGLEPLADDILKQDPVFDPVATATQYIDAEKELLTVDDVLSGARDIIAEWISEHEKVRERMRQFYWETGLFKSSVVEGKELEAQKYRDYFEWEEPLKTAPSHRVLAMRRGEKEEFLNLKVVVDRDQAIDIVGNLLIINESACAAQVKLAMEDGYKRLLSSSMETEMRLETKKKAEAAAITIFSENLRELLLAAPLGEKRIMAVDPGFRTGCKIVCLNAQGKYLASKTIYPHSGAHQAKKLPEMFLRYSRSMRLRRSLLEMGQRGVRQKRF